jgi:hypothetical protein
MTRSPPLTESDTRNHESPEITSLFQQHRPKADIDRRGIPQCSSLVYAIVWLAAQPPRRFRTIQVCSKDLLPVLRQVERAVDRAAASKVRWSPMSDMKRREFITLLGGASAWSVAARAQQPAMPVVGWISSTAARESAYLVAAFRQGLKETGYIEPQNVVLDFRWGDGYYDRLNALATELVRRPVTVIVATGGDPAAQAAKVATGRHLYRTDSQGREACRFAGPPADQV